MINKNKLIWEPAKVGCWWHSKDKQGRNYTIGTSVTYRDGEAILTFPESAYVLTVDFEERGRYKSLKAAQRGAEKLK